MKTYTFTRIGNSLAALSLLLGSAMTMQGTAILGSLTGPGAELHSAADMEALTPLQEADASLQLVFGILLILLGFFVHGYVRTHVERKVHITVKPSKKKKTERLFWMRIQM